MGNKILIECPKCSKRMRIPVNYFGAVRCPKCKFQFDKISKSDPESIGNEKPDKTNICIHCGAENDVNSTISENYDYFRCRSCDFDSPLSPKVGKTIHKKPWLQHFSIGPTSGVWPISIVGCFLWLLAGITVGMIGIAIGLPYAFFALLAIIVVGILNFFFVLFINPAAELVEQTIVSGLKEIKK